MRTALALAAAATLSATALAQTAPPPGGPMMRADANGDGVITRAEAIAEADATFTRADADRDGTVTAEERRAEREARMAERRGSDDGSRRAGRGPGDARGPGGRDTPGITREEARARAGERFDRMDANRDGRLDTGEMSAMRGPRRGSGDMPPAPPAERP